MLIPYAYSKLFRCSNKCQQRLILAESKCPLDKQRCRDAVDHAKGLAWLQSQRSLLSHSQPTAMRAHYGYLWDRGLSRKGGTRRSIFPMWCLHGPLHITAASLSQELYWMHSFILVRWKYCKKEGNDILNDNRIAMHNFIFLVLLLNRTINSSHFICMVLRFFRLHNGKCFNFWYIPSISYLCSVTFNTQLSWMVVLPLS